VVHRGEILRNAALKIEPNVSNLGRLVGYDRTSVYRHFAEENLDLGIILKYARALKHDFSKEFPELGNQSWQLQEPVGEYRPLTISDALKEIDYWRSKYIDLLERHTEMLKDMVKEKS
jgi:hypothetical protein